VRFLERLFSRDEPAPEWASFFKPGEFAEFCAAVESALKEMGRSYEIDASAGVVLAEEPGQEEPNRFGLLNLAQMCRQAPRLDWPSIIHRHFGQILRHRAEADDLMKRLESDFEAAWPLLKVRLYPADTPLDPSAVQHPAEGLLAALVYDLPETVMSVSKDHIARWGMPADELFKIALENVRNEPGIQDELLEIPGRVSFHILNGSSFFTATQALLLEQWLPKPLSELGALVAVPTRNTVIYHSIADETVSAAIHAMVFYANGLFQQGPGSITPTLYWWREAAWWHEGEFTTIPAMLHGNDVTVDLPEEFKTKVMERFG
jgi:hypothetical protein